MEYYFDQIRDEFKKLEWHQVYSFIEFVISQTPLNQKDALILEINKIFYEEGVPYKIVNGQVSQLLSTQEYTEITKAQDANNNAAIHIQRAIELFNKRPTPDYVNVIKESINALESSIKEITGETGGTLNSHISKLKLHAQLEHGIKNLYNWTSDEGGIRHGLKDGDKEPNENDARFMLSLCSSMINYLKSQNIKP